MAFIKTLVPGEKKPEGMIKIEGKASFAVRRESQKSERDCRILSDK